MSNRITWTTSKVEAMLAENDALRADNAQLRTAIRYVFRLGLPSEQRALLMRAMSTRHVGGTIIDVDPITGEEVGDHE